MAKSAAKSSGGYNVFPVGIAYVSASLKQCTPNVITSNLEFNSETTHNSLDRLINENNIDVICTSGLSRDYPKIKEIIDCSYQIKKEIITVIGGGIISGDPEPAMIALGADIGVIGQGEITMCELAKALDNGKDYSKIPGLIFKDKENNYVKTSLRKDIDNINLLPMPDYEGFKYSEYMKQTNHEAAFVVGSRSCPFHCTFCFHPSGNKYRQRSLKNLFDEIEFQIKNYSVKKIAIIDELFATSRKRVIEFCEYILRYNINWSVQLRVTDVDDKLLNIMRKAGCTGISFGIESADNSILKSMKKKITVEQIEFALSATHKANIEIQGGLIFGDIAETNETVNNTLEWYSKHLPYNLELNMIHIFPGTPIYDYAFKTGVIKDKIKFLIDGCPLVNVSKLTNTRYRALSSLLYEKNMRSKYLPKGYRIIKVNNNKFCKIEMSCNKCNFVFTLKADLLHIQRLNCPRCKQRHYVDPFLKLNHSHEKINNYFPNEKLVAIWGAGEICIKLLDEYSIFHKENFKIVDISKSRQGYSVCGKNIFVPEIISENEIETVIVAIVRRKDEVFKELKKTYPNITKILIPNTEITDGSASFCFEVII